jgi:hypothetical protein
MDAMCERYAYNSTAQYEWVTVEEYENYIANFDMSYFQTLPKVKYYCGCDNSIDNNDSDSH